MKEKDFLTWQESMKNKGISKKIFFSFCHTCLRQVGAIWASGFLSFNVCNHPSVQVHF